MLSKVSLFTFFLGFSRQGFSVALEPVLELALVDQTGLELTYLCLLSAYSLLFKNKNKQQPGTGWPGT